MKQPYNKKVSHYNANPFEKTHRSSKYKGPKNRLKSKKLTYNDPPPAAPVSTKNVVKSVDFAIKFGIGNTSLDKLIEGYSDAVYATVHDDIHLKMKPEAIKKTLADLKTLAAETGKVVLLKHQAPAISSQVVNFKLGDGVTFDNETFVVSKVQSEPGFIEPLPEIPNTTHVEPDTNPYLEKYLQYAQYIEQNTYTFTGWKRSPPTTEELADKFLADPANSVRDVRELAVSFARQQLDKQAAEHRQTERRLHNKMGQYRVAYLDAQKDITSLQARVEELEKQLERTQAQRSTIIASAITETSRTRLFRE